MQVYGEDESFSLASDSTWLCSESYSCNTGRFDFMDMGGGVLNGTAILNLAWEHYRIYGDRRILELALPAGIKWLAFLQKHVKNDMLTRYDTHGYFLGEWVSPGPVFEYGETEEALFNNNCAFTKSF